MATAAPPPLQLPPPPSNPTTFRADCMPPENSYSTQADLQTAINAHARAHGYAFVIQRSRVKNGSRRQEVLYACDCHNAPRAPNPDSNRKRRAPSRATGCLFSVVAKEAKDKSCWRVHWRVNPVNAVHNHPPSTDPAVHVVHRQFSDTAQKIIESLTRQGLGPKIVQTTIQDVEVGSLVSLQDIYNHMAASRRKVRRAADSGGGEGAGGDGSQGQGHGQGQAAGGGGGGGDDDPVQVAVGVIQAGVVHVQSGLGQVLAGLDQLRAPSGRAPGSTGQTPARRGQGRVHSVQASTHKSLAPAQSSQAQACNGQVQAQALAQNGQSQAQTGQAQAYNSLAQTQAGQAREASSSTTSSQLQALVGQLQAPMAQIQAGLGQMAQAGQTDAVFALADA